MDHSSISPIKRRLRSFRYAWNGVLLLFREQPNARIHAGTAVGVIVAGVILEISLSEWVWITACIVSVFAAELLNSAIEGLVDLISPHPDPRAGNIKDLAAGAVLVIAMGAAVTGLIIFLPYIYQLFTQ